MVSARRPISTVGPIGKTPAGLPSLCDPEPLDQAERASVFLGDLFQHLNLIFEPRICESPKPSALVVGAACLRAPSMLLGTLQSSGGLADVANFAGPRIDEPIDQEPRCHERGTRNAGANRGGLGLLRGLSFASLGPHGHVAVASFPLMVAAPVQPLATSRAWSATAWHCGSAALYSMTKSPRTSVRTGMPKVVKPALPTT
jgi:hypothetical protein